MVMGNYLDDFHAIVFMDDKGCFTKPTAAAERRAERSTAERHDLRIAVFMGIKFFACAIGSVAAAVANHHQGLTAFEFRLGSVVGVVHAKMKTNAISATRFYRGQKRFNFFDGKPYAKGISLAQLVRICCPSFLFVSK